MLKQTMGLTIRELAHFLKRNPQTIRLQLKNSGMLNKLCKAGREYILTEDMAQKFIAKCYAVHYNDFVNRFTYTNSEKGLIMFPIPKGIGAISSSLQSSGKRYYYIRNLPLYTDENGTIVTYKSKGFLSEQEAKDHRQEIIDNRNNGVYKLRYINELANSKVQQPNSKPELEESYYNFCLRYFKDANYATSTRESYIRLIEQRIKPFFKDIPIKNLNKRLLQKFVNQYASDIRRTFSILRQTLRNLYSLELIPEIYYDGLIKPKNTSACHPKEALTREEVDTVLNYLKDSPKEYPVLLLFLTGLRIGELQALYWSEIEILDDEHGKIHVNSSWGKTEIGMARKATKTKSSKRIVPFTSARLVHLLKIAQRNSKTKWVLENSTGTGPIEKKNFTNRYFKSIGKQLGITKPMSSHVARHTYISHLIRQNVPYTTIAKLVGHDTTEMIIKVYAHAVENPEQEFKYVADLYT